MPRHINRIVLLSFMLYLVSILTAPSILSDHLVSAAASENQADAFTFVRLKYRGARGHRGKWDTDWPASDRNFIFQLRKQTNSSSR